MPDGTRGYAVGYGKPPVHTRFAKGRSGNPGTALKRYSLETNRLEEARENLKLLDASMAVELGRADASVLVCYMADLERALAALGNRGYRDAHLEAGLHAGRAYLAAYALGRGATGLTFYDDDVTRFFSPHAEGKSAIFLVAVGKSAKLRQ